MDELFKKIDSYVKKRVSNSADAEDLVQDIFLKMQAGLSKLKSEEKIIPWVYRIARNSIIDYYRKKPRLEWQELPENLSSSQQEDPSVREEIKAWLPIFIKVLPPADQEVLTLFELEGLNQKEIANKLEISLCATKSRILRARNRLKESLMKCCQFYFDPRGKVRDYQVNPQSSPECC